jgi:hypothetical protein
MTGFIAIDAKSRDRVREGPMVQRRLSTTAEGLARRSLPWVAHDAAAPHSATRLLLVSASPNRSGKPFRLRTRMWSESSTMQAFLHGRWDKILPWQSEAVTHWLNGFLHHSAAHPKQSSKIDTRSRRRDGIERVGYINPGHTFAACVIRERKESAT